MLTKLGCILAVLVVCLHAQVSTYKEVHPDSQVCLQECYSQFMGEDKVSSEKCDSCCTGCRFMSVIGLTSEDGDVKKDRAQSECYKACEDAGKDGNCQIGCDTELKEAEKELKNLNFDSFAAVSDSFASLINSFFPVLSFDSSQAEPIVAQPQIDPVPLDEGVKTQGAKKDEVVSVSNDEEDEDLDFFTSLLKDMGILGEGDKLVPVESQESVRHRPKVSAQDSLSARELSNGEGEPTHQTYLRSLWRDRNTVQILLVSSITACLFAILWMLCNSSSDPIVRRVSPASDDAPPAYNVVYEDKKLPILVVAGIEEQAEALPEKVPLGHSTQI